MNKTVLAIVLIAAGSALLFFGNQRRDSVAGAAQSVGQNVASAVDGKARVNDHTLFFVAGGALILVGLGVVLRKTG